MKISIAIRIFVVAVLCAAVSCQTRPAPVEDMYVKPGVIGPSVSLRVSVRDLVIKKELNASGILENAQSIVSLLLEKFNTRPAVDNAENKSMVADIIIREDSFLKDFETMNAISCEIRVYEKDAPAGKPVILYLTTEETTDTITSYRYLYALLDRALRTVLP